MNPSFDRRSFISRAALLPLGGAVASGFGAVASAQTPIKRTGGVKYKFGLNAYSFTKLLNDNIKGRGKGISLLELIDYAAEQNFDAIDPTGYFFPGYPKPPADKYVNDFKRRAFVQGLDISGTGVRNDLASPDKQKRAADVQHIKEWVEVAARLGAPVLRVFSGPTSKDHTWDQVAEWMVEELKKCVEHAAKFGVIIGIQNHGDMLKSADEVLKIIKMVDSEWFGAIVDTGYFMTDDPYADMARVIPHAVNWQIKEKIDGRNFKVKIDLKRLVKIVRESNYRGYLPIETLSESKEKADYDPRVRVAAFFKELRAAFQEG
jgi:sugar phosphate isomerase/epimerase